MELPIQIRKQFSAGKKQGILDSACRSQSQTEWLFLRLLCNARDLYHILVVNICILNLQ